jgi:hypothetical protein
MSNRSSLLLLLLIAPLSWGGLLLFSYFVPPASFLSFATFFLVLTVALTSTFSPIAYVIGSRVLSLRLYRTTMRYAIRQGALLSLVIVLNLIMRSLQSWNVFTAIVILGAAVVLEVLSLARK